MAQDWAYYIDQANKFGNEELRKQYIKMRDAGVPVGMVQANSVDLGGGYNLNALEGYLTNNDGYSYSTKENFTKIGDSKYKGYFDSDIMSQIGDDEWTKAYDSNRSYLDTALGAEDEEGNRSGGSIDQWIESEYLKNLTKHGGQYNDAVDIDGDRLFKSIGVDDQYKEVFDFYNQNVLEDAYLSAYNRLNPNAQAQKGFTNRLHGTGAEILNQDWSSLFKLPQQEGTPDMDAYRQYMYQKTGDTRYMQPLEQPVTSQPQKSTSPAYSDKPYSVANQTPSVMPNTSQPATQQPSTPAQSTSMQPESLDWKGLYDQLSEYVTNLSAPSKQATSKNPANQLVNNYDYAPAATYNKSSYQSSTPYSGKGA